MSKFYQNTLIGILMALLVGCETITPNGKEQETKLIIDMLLSDMPLPERSSIQTDKTVIIGSGGGWAGKIVLHAPQSKSQALKFFRDNTVGSGWQLLSSTVSDSIIMVYRKNDIYSTIEIFNRSRLSSGTAITISVVPNLTEPETQDQ